MDIWSALFGALTLLLGIVVGYGLARSANTADLKKSQEKKDDSLF